MPLEEPSKFGLTMTGKRRFSAVSSLSFSTYCQPGVRMPCLERMSLVSCLSRVTASAYASLPVYGKPSSSKSAGKKASRKRPRRPSAVLKIRSGL